ncbi:MAG: ATP-binding cassette domain-containing protein [Planctomycetota bacterium]
MPVERSSTAPTPVFDPTQPPDVVLELAGVQHSFGDFHVLHDLNLKVVRGQVAALVGPSGCGKSTLLRAILGTHPPNNGRVLVNGTEVTGPGRDRGMVYQRYSLYPFLTAEENVAFGPMLDRTTLPFRAFRPLKWRAQKKEILAEARELLVRLKLEASMQKYPHEMSGGMCQRVAIAQALIMKPEILLLDEPFGALDEATREEMQEMILDLYHDNIQVQQEGGVPPYTILIVTHELNEAIYVADRIIGLSQYWNWEESGQAKAGPHRCPGATFVYDAVAPVFHSDNEREMHLLNEQRAEIRETVFNESLVTIPAAGVTFWQQRYGGGASQ